MRCGRSWGLSSEREGQTFAGESLLVRYSNFVKLPHTVFALPFALLGVVAASYAYPVTWRVLGLVVLAFTAARFEWAAWALNPLCFALSPIALGVVMLYSYTKRCTGWSQRWIGVGEAI